MNPARHNGTHYQSIPARRLSILYLQLSTRNKTRHVICYHFYPLSVQYSFRQHILRGRLDIAGPPPPLGATPLVMPPPCLFCLDSALWPFYLLRLLTALLEAFSRALVY